MSTTRLEREMREQGEVRGHFWPADAGEASGAPGVLRWSAADGVRLEIHGGFDSGPGDAGDAIAAIHGESLNHGRLSILGGWISRRSIGGIGATEIVAPTALCECHTDAAATWDRITVVTTHMHEWYPATGLTTDRDTDQHGTTRFAWIWERPESRSVEIAGGRITLLPAMDTELVRGPDCSMQTRIEARFEPHEPLTLDQLDRGFGFPLLAFLAFAADSPEATVREVVGAPRQRRAGVVLRRAIEIAPARVWSPDDRFLLWAHDVDDELELLDNWFRLYESAGAALATFFETIQLGRSYTRVRLIALVTALEAFWRSAVGSYGGTFVEKLQALRAFSGVNVAATGCSDERIGLIATARNYYAHLGETRSAWSPAAIDEALLDNCRCAAALMQASVLRALDVAPDRAGEVLVRHHRSWPLPASPAI